MSILTIQKGKSSPQKRPQRPRREVEVQLYSSLNLSARWGWVVNTIPWPLYTWERPGTHCVEGCVGPRADLDGCEKSCPPTEVTTQQPEMYHMLPMWHV
jgi:hypothetical protein